MTLYHAGDVIYDIKYVTHCKTSLVEEHKHEVWVTFISLHLMIASEIMLTLNLLSTTIVVFANSVEPDETAPIGAVSSGSALFAMGNSLLQTLHYRIC